jgi:hypothetical protein
MDIENALQVTFRTFTPALISQEVFYGHHSFDTN